MTGMSDPRAGQDAERRAAVPVGGPSNGVGGWVSGSGVLSFPVFRQEGMDLVGGEGAVGEFFQALSQVETEVEAGALGAGQYGHDGGDGRAAVLGAQVHPVFAAQGDWSHGVFTPVVIDFEQAVGCEDAQALPLVEEVIAGLGQQAGWQSLLADLDRNRPSLPVWSIA